MSMQKTTTSIPPKVVDPENMHVVDRTLRIVIGTGMFAMLHPAFSLINEPYVILLPLLAIYPLMTGILAWDPFYELMRVRTNTPEDAPRDLQILDDEDEAPMKQEPVAETTRKVA